MKYSLKRHKLVLGLSEYRGLKSRVESEMFSQVKVVD